MSSRLRFIQKQRGTNGKTVRKYIKYPNIPLSVDDIYAITVEGDRLDLIASQFYNDVDLWWVITTANPNVIRRDSLVLIPGLQIRIPNPSRITNILRSFEQINK
jgi:hypothetical protein